MLVGLVPGVSARLALGHDHHPRFGHHHDELASVSVGEEAGTIETGKRANLVLLDGNPLTDIANTRRISGVMIQGRWLGRDDIDRRLEELAANYELEN